MAASAAGKEKIIYHPFHDADLSEGIKKLVSFILENKFTVEKVYKVLLTLTPKNSIPDTFSYLLSNLKKEKEDGEGEKKVETEQNNNKLMSVPQNVL